MLTKKKREIILNPGKTRVFRIKKKVLINYFSDYLRLKGAIIQKQLKEVADVVYFYSNYYFF